MTKLALIMFAALLPVVVSRECYQCLSTHSFKECDSKRIKVKCLTSQRCVKVSAHSSSDEAYGRGCAATCDKTSVPVCNEPGVTCKVDCCSSDYCNTGASPVVSGVLITACVFLVTGVWSAIGYY